MVDEHILNEIETQIEKATLQLFKQEEVFANIVQQCIGLGYDFASIQLIRSEEQIIEAVKGTDWAGKARHYLEPDPSLRDIQADICQTCRTEVIAGWDKRGRFDKWVYDDNNHQDLIRIFTPLILVQDDKGKNDQQWFNDLRGNFINHEVTENWFKEIGQNQSQDNGQQSVAEIFLPESCVGDEVKVIGTIEVGYKNPLKKIEIEEVIDLIKKVGDWALKIRETQLPCVLDKIAKIAMKAVEADGTSLHFLEGLPLKPYVLEVISDGSIKKKPLVIEADRIPYSYEVFSELIGRDFIRKSPPRKGGLGQKAIKNDQEKFVPDLSQGQNAITLKNYNQKAFDLGIKAIIIIPLIVEQYTGCLYFHFKKENPFDKRVISWLKLFHNRVEEAIRHGITYEHQRDRNTQLKVLHSVAQSLTKNLDKEDLLNQIAWSTLNLLAADTITIYRYIEANEQFLPEPARAGRLKFSQQAQTEKGEAADSDGKVHIMRLCDYISQNVPQQQSTQHPFIKLASENFVIAINPEFSKKPPNQQRTPTPNNTVTKEQLRKQIKDAYTDSEFETLCGDMEVEYQDLLQYRTLDLQRFHLIDICYRHGKYQDLVNKVHNHPYFANQETIKTS
jgi:GAF domain-containing protein